MSRSTDAVDAVSKPVPKANSSKYWFKYLASLVWVSRAEMWLYARVGVSRRRGREIIKTEVFSFQSSPPNLKV